MDIRNNSFGYMRILAAVSIMISHYCTFFFTLEEIPFRRILFAGPSLVFFFVLCGFLLAPSLERSCNGLQYAKKKIKRIYPVYLTTVFTTMIFGLVLGKGSALEAGNYFLKMLLKPGGYVFCGVSNGSVWALFIELQIYVLGFLTYKYWKNNHSYILCVGGGTRNITDYQCILG